MIKWSLYILIVVCSSVQLQAATISVCSECPVSAVKDAVAAANHGDTISIHPGVYYESNIIISKPLCIRGIEMPVLDGNHHDEILIVSADSVTVEGIEFRNAGFSHVKDLAAIRIKRKDHFVIRGNHVTNTLFGIYVENGKHGIIENNVLLGNAVNEMTSGNAIHCWYAEDLIIRNNIVRKYRDGIYLEFVNNSEITDNFSEGNIRYGLHFMFSNDDQYNCNIFSTNGAGVAVMFSKRIKMRENTFRNNWGRSSYGLLLKEIYDAEIEQNEFLQNTIGILVEGSSRLVYQHNRFRNNGWAIQMSGGCLDNNFTRNDFISNTMDLVVYGRINNNSFDGNYWSDYSGYDLDHDGVGEPPFRPVKLFSYILTKSPESIMLLRSFFIDLLNLTEKVTPVFTPQDVLDHQPLMQPVS